MTAAERPSAANLPVGTVIHHRGLRIERRDPADLVGGPVWRANNGDAWEPYEIDWLLDAGAAIAHTNPTRKTEGERP